MTSIEKWVDLCAWCDERFLLLFAKLALPSKGKGFISSLVIIA